VIGIVSVLNDRQSQVVEQRDDIVYLLIDRALQASIGLSLPGPEPKGVQLTIRTNYLR